MRRRTTAIGVLLGVLLCGSASQAGTTESSYKEEARGGKEEIYIFRTTRTQHKTGVTPGCAAAPFASANEDFYALWSMELRGRDSRVVNTHKRPVGGFTACLGQLAKGRPVQMYATGTVAHIPWVGVGECTVLRSQPPVGTAVAFTCRLDLSGLPEPYAGGYGVSSTLSPYLPKDPDPGAHVPGYVSTSIVTLRLWKKPLSTGK